MQRSIQRKKETPTVLLSKHFTNNNAHDFNVVKMVSVVGEKLRKLGITCRAEQVTYEQFRLCLPCEENVTAAIQ